MTEFRRQRLWWDVGVPIVLLLIALLPRVVVFGSLTNPDELGWLRRSVDFYDALSKGDWAATSQAFHPGVVPMWGFGGLIIARFGLPQVQAWLTAEALPMADLARAALYFPILISVLTVLAVYGLVRRLADREAGLYGALLLAVSPYYLAFTYMIHMDLIHASLMLVAALLWLNTLHAPRRWPYLVGAGVVAGMAVLTRSASLYLLPYTLLAAGVYFVADNWAGTQPWLRPGWGRWLGRMALAWPAWLGLLAVTVVLLWPALWVDPGAVVTRMASGIFKSVENAHPAPAFFLGEIITGDPGVLYYWLVLLFRLRPLTLVLVILNPVLLILAWRRLSPQKRAAWVLGLAYPAFYLLQMSLATHKLERYMVPVVVALVLLAGVSLAVLAQELHARLTCWRERSPFPLWRLITLGSMIALLAIPALRLGPYYAAYFNPLVGGAQKASELFTVGGGLGLDQAADYLNDKPDVENLRASSFYNYVFECYFEGATERPNEASWAGLPIQADYAVITNGQAQRDIYPATLDFFRAREPEYTVRINDIDYVWIYRVPRRPLDASPPIQHLLDSGFEGRVRLLGYDVRWTEDALLVTLYWQPLTTMHHELWVTLRLVDESGKVVLEQGEPPWSGDVTLLSWPDSFAIQDTHTLFLSDIPLSEKYYLVVSLSQRYKDGQERLLPLTGSEALQLTLGPIAVAPQREPSQPVVEGNLGGLVRLVGYDPAPPLQAEGGASLPLTLTWEALAPMTDDYTVFVHLTGEDGRPLAQADGPPLAGAYPTSFWKVGERLADAHLLAMPPEVPAGDYQLRVGMYLLATGERLPLLDAEGQVAGDHIRLGPVTVASP